MIHRITLCLSCTDNLAPLAARLQTALQAYSVTVTACMSGCTRPATASFRAENKTAYLFGDLTAADLPDLITFAHLYLTSPDGTFPDARPLGALRHKALARIPA